MTLHNAFDVYVAEQVKNSIVTSGSQLYLTFGRHFSWTNEAAPDTANTSTVSDYDIWRYMVGGKKIIGNDIRQVVPRYDWAANTNYAAYDDRNPDLFESNFYVLTSDMNVYKCLSNNEASISTIMPTQVTPNVSVSTADGYIWKFMYNLSSEEQVRFLTSNYMPVKTLPGDDGSLQWFVQQAAVPGSILTVEITSGGIGYTNVSNLIVNIGGDGVSAAAIGKINNHSNTVNSVVIINPGLGYTNAVVEILGGGGHGANARALIPPFGGHGSNPLYELGGSNIIINTKLDGSEEGTIPVTNDFRQIAIIKDPLLTNNTSIATISSFDQTTKIFVTGVSSDFQNDEYVYQGSSLVLSFFSARVNKWDSGNNILKVTETRGVPRSDTILGQNTFSTAFVTSVENPDLTPYTGQVLYSNNMTAITREENQSDDFKILISIA